MHMPRSFGASNCADLLRVQALQQQFGILHPYASSACNMQYFLALIKNNDTCMHMRID